MRLSDYDTSKRYQATVCSSKRLTPTDSDDEVKEIALSVTDYTPKRIEACIGVVVPGPHDYGHKTHFRLYTLADVPVQHGNNTQITIVVKRCNNVDPYSGESYRGIASNYLCDLKVNEAITITGPYSIPFAIPDDKSANILMIGMGTGIAPFRAFVKHIYKELGGWEGKVRLFYGARTGLELLYMNKHHDDFSNYYDEETFQAFSSLSIRPHWDEDVALTQALELQEQEVWDLICCHNTYVYVAGHNRINTMLDKAFAEMAGSQDKWYRRKKELQAGQRWMELLY
ncbi:MAG: ferredoxin-NADP reductase [Gammaproteobacteria bacterium]|nr:ferredoxin-NADP reductase [Gammaproteobacteria bacterium]MDH5802940.1 ferredoxin-NADP reductase [Gammaproteobacteria bacterium]